MAVYVDDARIPWGRYIMSHMTADTEEELHAMADKIGVKRKWFQGPPEHSLWHYDLSESKRLEALAQGAIAEDWRDSGAIERHRRLRRQQKEEAMPKWIGVVGLDPGGTTGYVQSVFPTKGSTEHKIARRKLDKALLFPSKGIGFNGLSNEGRAAQEIFLAYKDFHMECSAKGVPVVMVIEDFTLLALGTSERHGIATVRVTAALEPLIWQYAQEELGEGMEWAMMPWYIGVSTASQVATDARLKKWGAWDKGTGMEHCRSARRIQLTYVREHHKQPREQVAGATNNDGSIKRFKSSGNY